MDSKRESKESMLSAGFDDARSEIIIKDKLLVRHGETWLNVQGAPPIELQSSN